MDPKTMPNLDPKLKEVYERVMKTQTQPPPQPPPSPPPPTPQPQAQPPPPVPPAVNNEPSPAPSAKPPAAELSPTPQNTFHSTQVFNPDAPSSTTSPSTDAAAPKSKGKISPVVLVLTGVVFFVIYAIVWMKIFNLSLPI